MTGWCTFFSRLKSHAQGQAQQGNDCGAAQDQGKAAFGQGSDRRFERLQVEGPSGDGGSGEGDGVADLIGCGTTLGHMEEPVIEQGRGFLGQLSEGFVNEEGFELFRGHGSGYRGVFERNLFAYHRDGMMETGSHRSHGDAESFGDFGVSELLGEAQFEDLALEGRKGFDDFPGGLNPGIRGQGHCYLHARIRPLLLLPIPPLPRRLTDVPGDAEEIGPQRTGFSPPVEATRHFEKGLLDEILRSLAAVSVTAREIARQILRRLPEESLEIGLLLVDGLQGGWEGAEEIGFPTSGRLLGNVGIFAEMVHRCEKILFATHWIESFVRSFTVSAWVGVASFGQPCGVPSRRKGRPSPLSFVNVNGSTIHATE